MLYLDLEKKEFVITIPTSLDPSLEFENKFKNVLTPLYGFTKEELDYIKRKIDELKQANPPLVISKS